MDCFLNRSLSHFLFFFSFKNQVRIRAEGVLDSGKHSTIHYTMLFGIASRLQSIPDCKSTILQVCEECDISLFKGFQLTVEVASRRSGWLGEETTCTLRTEDLQTGYTDQTAWTKDTT